MKAEVEDPELEKFADAEEEEAALDMSSTRFIPPAVPLEGERDTSGTVTGGTMVGGGINLSGLSILLGAGGNGRATGSGR